MYWYGLVRNSIKIIYILFDIPETYLNSKLSYSIYDPAYTHNTFVSIFYFFTELLQKVFCNHRIWFSRNVPIQKFAFSSDDIIGNVLVCSGIISSDMVQGEVMRQKVFLLYTSIVS